MNDPAILKNLTFKPCGNVGYNIETLLGIMPNSLPYADGGEWEIKSRCVTAKALVTLGGKRTNNTDKLLNQVYNKIKSTIFVEYENNEDFTITITQITKLSGLDKETFVSQYGKMIKMELKKDGQKSLKITRNNLFRLFPKKVTV